MIIEVLLQIGQMLLVVALAPLLTGFVRKIKARLQSRQGPSLLQPYRDLLKLLRKEVVRRQRLMWLFRAAPYLIFAATDGRIAGADFCAELRSAIGGLLVIVALLGSAGFSRRSRGWISAPALAASDPAAK
jgi:formate hydrogenlyase subunit 4